jgi:hypothetical protein
MYLGTDAITDRDLGFALAHKATHFFLADPWIPIHFIGKKMVSQLMSTCESDTGLRNEDMDSFKVLALLSKNWLRVL